ncbi:hypothetical protein D0Z03_002239 [Geotrichum reessii]|nr:hypothetical protein D0Z03_002239 [Galactomyces reessii]
MPQYLPPQAHQLQPANYGQAPADWQPHQQQMDNRGQSQSPNRVTSPGQQTAQSRYYKPQDGPFQQKQQNSQQPYPQQQQNYYPQQQQFQQRTQRGEYSHNVNNSQDSYNSSGSGRNYRQPQQYQEGENYYQPPQQQPDYYSPQQQQQQQGYRPSSQQSVPSARNNNNSNNNSNNNNNNNKDSSRENNKHFKLSQNLLRMYNNESVTNSVVLAATNGGSGGDNDSDSMSVTVDDVPTPSPVTVGEFESLRHSAKLSPTDTELQVKYAKRLTEAGVVLASKYSDPTTPAGTSAVVDTKTERKNRDTWNTQSLKILKKIINQHVSNANRTAITDAMFFLATNYGSGSQLGLEPDYEKAHDLYVRAARLDHPESCYRAAVCSEIGAGTRRDAGRALQWYKRAAQLGDVSAMYKLGMIALNGLLGQPRDFMDGFAWLQRAADRADHANPHAVHELGLLYERGQSPSTGGVGSNGNSGDNDGAAIALSAIIVKDEARALELFTRAARLGYPPSQYRLGAAYEYGTLGRPVDPKRSIAWYSHAAERGEPESELALSGWYLTGSNGVLQQSDTEAYLWARRAAEKGLAKAEYALGYFVEVGIGVKPDLEEAKRWYFKAAAQKHPKALARLQELRSAKQ